MKDPRKKMTKPHEQARNHGHPGHSSSGRAPCLVNIADSGGLIYNARQD